MAYNASDDEITILRELGELRHRLSRVLGMSYKKCQKRKFLRHRIADLEWNLKHPDNKV